MSGDIGLGSLCDDFRQKDAVHVAVAPVIAGENLNPGDHVKLNEEGHAIKSKSSIGIVDCFLCQTVKKGQKFYLMLYPGTIRSIRHDWVHPAFPSAEIKETIGTSKVKLDAYAWLNDYAASIGSSLEELLYRTEDYLNHEEYWNEGERFNGEYLPDEFWKYYQDYTGREVPENKQYSFFSCSC